MQIRLFSFQATPPAVHQPSAPTAALPSAHDPRTPTGDLLRSPLSPPTAQAAAGSVARASSVDGSPRPAAQTGPVCHPSADPCLADPCLAAAYWFQSVAIATMTLELRACMGQNGEGTKKPFELRGGWETRCNVGNRLESWVQPRQNWLAIATGASEICVVDVDAKAKGGEAFDEMLAEHGPLPADTPWEWTGHRPGKHLFFSLSQSKEAGLLSGRNRGGLLYKGKKVGIDTRGKGGMVFVGPSSYESLDGTVRSYEWVRQIAPDRSNLQAPCRGG